MLASAIAAAAFAAPAASDESKDKQTADSMLAKIEAVKPPSFDAEKRTDQAYVQDYVAKRNQAMREKADLEAKFLAAYPDHPKATALRSDRWRILAGTGEMKKAQAEAEEFLKQPGHEHDADTMYFLAMLATRAPDSAAAKESVERFIQANPSDARGAQLLYSLVRDDAASDEGKAILQRILKDYPNSPTAKMAKGQTRRTDELGKPFELSFTEAISGKPISMSDLRGKVVVVDFWATWCGPCVAEMPNMKKLYAEFKPKGVEFIGVSLDQPEAAGGLKALKEFVAKNEIAWPQYYQGKGWDSEFSVGWGVNSIPCVFVVDAEGKLASTDARGKLETLLPELIQKRDGKTADARQ